MPEPLLVRSITYAPLGPMGQIVHTNAITDGTKPALTPAAGAGYTVNAGTYLHRDDVCALLLSMVEEESDAAAKDALTDAARQIRTRGQS
jgi:hypothetical protein